MCDYSLHYIELRPAKVGEKLTTRDFGTETRGFAASEDAKVAVCVLPGTELSFAGDVTCLPIGLLAWRERVSSARFLRCSLITNHPNGRRVSVHWFAGVLQSLCSLS